MLVKLPPNPTREDLRFARQTLVGLKAAAVPGAATELADIDALIRALYPRVPTTPKADLDGVVNGPAPRKRGRRKRRKLIIAEDCLGTCPRCDGRKFIDRSRLLACPRCDGTGIAPIAAAEHDPAECNLHGRGRPIRGEWAQQTGVSDMPRFAGTPNRRGYYGSTRAGGASMGPARPEEREAYLSFNPRQLDRTDPRRLLPPPLWPRQADAADVSAELESRAIAAARDDETGPLAALRGRALVGLSQREVDLTPGQRGRNRMEDRVRRMQSEANRRSRSPRGVYARSDGADTLALLKTLERLGIDTEAVKASIKAARAIEEAETVNQARRRGDLPPDDLLTPPDPAWRVRIPGGLEGHAEQSNLVSALVRRPDGSLERVDRPTVVRLDNGEVELVHPDDVAAV